MALIAWYPLNGHIHNQGIGNAEGTIVTTPAYTNGKTGQCLTTGGFKWTSEQAEELFSDEAFSYCCWIYIPVDAGTVVSGNNCFFGRSTNPRLYSIFQYPNADDLHLSWIKYTNVEKTTTETTVGGVWADFFEVRTWIHLAVTYKPGEVKIYKNGNLYATLTGKTMNYSQYTGFNYETNVISTSSQRYMNDVRIYNECLSQKQIKEIAKGLCAHYKLEGVGANPNLLYPSRLTESPTSFNTRNWSVGTINNVNSSSFTSEGFSVTTPGNQTGNPNNGRMIDLENANTLIPAGTKVTFSIDIKGAATTARIRGFYQGTGTAFYSNFVPINEDTTATDSEWHRYYGTFTMPDVGTTDKNLHIALSQGWDEVTTRVYRNARLSLADGTTYWIPNINETDYNKLGFNNICSRDVSGFDYNGTQYGSLVFNTDSPRYAGSTDFSDYGYLHYLSSPLNSSTDAFTFTCWFNPTQASNMALYNDRTTVGSGFSVFYLDSKKIRFDTGGNSQFFQTGTVDINTWTFIACVYDKNNNTKKIYINGALDGSSSSIGDLIQIGTNASIGNSSTNAAAGAGNQIYGSLSDVRIYCTALSADDILKLYEISGIIDNEGNMYSYEFKEE